MRDEERQKGNKTPTPQPPIREPAINTCIYGRATSFKQAVLRLFMASRHLPSLSKEIFHALPIPDDKWSLNVTRQDPSS